jgi:hypothetical protein
VGRNRHRAGGLPVRAARLFLRRNELRRRSERIEAVVVGGLLAVFVAAVVVAAFAAVRVYRSEQAANTGLLPAVAVISAGREPAVTQILNQSVPVRATWRLGDGAARSGLLTVSVAPGIYRQPPGTAIRLWVNRSGVPQLPPQGLDGMIIGAVMAGLAVVAAAAGVLSCGYLLCLRVLERYRLAHWSSAWAVTGPQWTGRR